MNDYFHSLLEIKQQWLLVFPSIVMQMILSVQFSFSKVIVRSGVFINLWLIRWPDLSFHCCLWYYFWLISTLWHPLPLSVSLRWLYSPELQHSFLNASITQTSRYNDYLSSACFWGSECSDQLFPGTNFKFKVQILMWTCFFLPPQELYQKLTDYDIRFYMYELLKVRIVQMLNST